MKKTGAAGPHSGPSLKAIPFLKTAEDAATITLTKRQREQLTQIGTRMRLPARKLIYREGSDAEWLFSINEGAVKSYRDLPSGKRTVCAFLFDQDLFGLAEKGRYLNTLQTIVPSTLYRFPLTELITLLKQDAELQLQFLAKVTHELRESQRRAILINRRDAAGRLAMFLALMAARADAAAQRAHEVPLPMSRSDIADFLGLSLESVSRASAELQSQGLVKFESRHLARILDPARLSKLAAAV